MSSIVVSYPPTANGPNTRSTRGRNAATQAPGDSMRVKRSTSTPSRITKEKHTLEKESDFDSNYQSSDKSSPESPRPFSMADIGRGSGTMYDSEEGVRRESSFSCSESETTPTSAKSSYDSNRVTVEIGGTDQKIYHIPVGQSPDQIREQESILDVAMTPPIQPDQFRARMSPEEAERERASRQRTTDRCSLMALIPSLGMIIICPWFMLPIFTVPNPHTEAFKIAILAGTPLALFFLAMGCLLGNIIWYYDSDRGKMRWFVNCGGKIKDHYWGYDLFNGFQPRNKTSAVREI